MLLFLSSKLISVGILKIINFETNLLNLYISCNIYKIPRGFVLLVCLAEEEKKLSFTLCGKPLRY